MRIPPGLVATPLYFLYRALCSSLHYREVNRKAVENVLEQSSCVLALWHDELFPVMRVRGRWPIMAVVSQSHDGEILSQVLDKLGVSCVRGSSSRGGVKVLLTAARKLAETPQGACITVDGPRGPRHKVKGGAIYLAAKANIPIAPMRLFMDRSYAFNSWDRFQVPLPFSGVTMVYGTPWRVEADVRDAEAMERERQLLEHRMETLAP